MPALTPDEVKELEAAMDKGPGVHPAGPALGSSVGAAVGGPVGSAVGGLIGAAASATSDGGKNAYPQSYMPDGAGVSSASGDEALNLFRSMARHLQTLVSEGVKQLKQPGSGQGMY